MTPVINKILLQLENFSSDEQRQVLRFVEFIRASKGKQVSGKELLQFVGTISSDDLALMKDAIEAGCEQINPNEW